VDAGDVAGGAAGGGAADEEGGGGDGASGEVGAGAAGWGDLVGETVAGAELFNAAGAGSGLGIGTCCAAAAVATAPASAAQIETEVTRRIRIAGLARPERFKRGIVSQFALLGRQATLRRARERSRKRRRLVWSPILVGFRS
jgi:hypothetical protein